MRHNVSHRLVIASVSLTVLVASYAVQPAAHAQVYLVKNVNPTGGTGLFRVGAAGSVVFFSADDGNHGEELWRSDGTEVGTYLVEDIWPATEPDFFGAYSSKPGQMVAVGSTLYFAASGREDPTTHFGDFELWMAGTGGPGASSLDIWSGTTSSSPSCLVAMGGALYLSAYDEVYGNEVIKVTEGSHNVLKDIEAGVGNSNPLALAVVNLQGTEDRLFFSAVTFDDGRELWMSDGTESGTSMVKQIYAGSFGSSPHSITEFEGKAYFVADDGVNGEELWVSDGTGGGTVLLKDINTSGSSSPNNLTVVGERLYFLADDGTHGYELWKSDGTVDGTVMVKDLEEGAADSSIMSLTDFQDTLFFAKSTSADGAELWTSDGSADGTAMFKDIRPGSEDALTGWPDPPELVVADDLLYFPANDGVNGAELWVTDGTPGKTLMVDNTASFWSVEGPKGLTEAGNLLFFQTDSDSGRELHAVNTADIVTQPSAPAGTVAGNTETSHTYTTGGSISLKGNDVQYRFVWGDGTDSGWLPVGVTSADKNWDIPDIYTITAEAKAATASSTPSGGLQVTMSFNEIISQPQLTGPSVGSVGVTYDFTIDGISNYDHALEYTVDWGDGEDNIDWTAFGPGNTVDLSNAWSFAAEHTIQVGVRCGIHTGLENWMDTTMTISDGPPPSDEIFSDGFESGDTAAW